MRRTFTLIALFGLFLVPVSAQDDDAPLGFTALSEDAVIRHSSSSSAWDGRFTDPGAVIFHDGLFHIFRNGFPSWPGVVGVEHLTSEDGATWTASGEEPLFLGDIVPYAEFTALASDVLVEDDGTWVLYFYTWEAASGPAPSGIGRATAPTPDGPWTADPKPLLNPGPEGAWDSAQVNAPRVIKIEDGYVMYYAGIYPDPSRTWAIGRATSPDGITWTKHDDPATTDAEFAESDPVFTDDEALVHQPMVTTTDEGYLMLYRRLPVGQRATSATVQAATSDDGITWTPLQEEPVWDRKTVDTVTTLNFWFTALARHNDTLYLFVEEGGSTTDIYVGTLTLDGM